MMSRIYSLCLLASLWILCCDASSSPNGGAGGGAGGGGTPGAGSGGAPAAGDDVSDPVANSYACEATPTQPRYCPNGCGLEGVQSCTPNGQGGSTVGPCSGCPEAPEPPAQGDGSLCAELRAQVGCEATTYRSDELPASVLFLVDRSGSMLCNAPPIQASADCGIEPLDASLPSKWDIVVDSLGQTFADLVGSNVNAALCFFSADGECATDSTPAVPLSLLDPGQLAALDGALADGAEPGRVGGAQSRARPQEKPQRSLPAVESAISRIFPRTKAARAPAHAPAAGSFVLR